MSHSAQIFMDETRIINEAQKGSLAAFNQLIMAYRVIGNGDAAADACQDAFIKAYKAITQYQGGSFKGWLLRIVTNTCYDYIRYKSRRPATSLEDMVENSDDHSSKLVSESERPEDHVLRLELNDVIQM